MFASGCAQPCVFACVCVCVCVFERVTTDLSLWYNTSWKRGRGYVHTLWSTTGESLSRQNESDSNVGHFNYTSTCAAAKNRLNRACSLLLLRRAQTMCHWVVNDYRPRSMARKQSETRALLKFVEGADPQLKTFLTNSFFLHPLSRRSRIHWCERWCSCFRPRLKNG